MGSLVLELQRESLDSKVPITDLLRKALVVARKLGIKEFQEWVESELNGYSRGFAIPEYRNVKGQIKCWNPYNGWIDFHLEPKYADKFSELPLGQAITEIEDLLKRNHKNFVMHYPKEIEHRLMEWQEWPPLRPAVLVDPSKLAGICATVRNVVLNWTMKLEEDGILGKGMTFTKKEKETASSSETYNIGTYIGNMHQSQLQQDTRDSTQSMTVNELDTAKVLSLLEEIKKAVADLDLPRDTRDELDAEIATAETQAKSPKPKHGIIRESLHTVRNILEGATGSLIASGIPPGLLERLLEQLKAFL